MWITGGTSTYDPILVRTPSKGRMLEAQRAAFLRNRMTALRSRPRKRPARSAMFLSLTFVAGWLAASIL